MARLVLDDQAVEVRLTCWEKLLARRGGLRVARGAVRDAFLQPEWWRCLRGVRVGGVGVPDRVYAGVWRHPQGRDFLVVHPRRGPLVCVDLAPSAGFVRVAVTVAPGEGNRVVRALGGSPAGPRPI